MRVHHIQLNESNEPFFELIDDRGQPIAIVSSFLRHLRARGYSPNTLSAYAYDLLHFMTWLALQQISYQEFTPARSLLFLEYLGSQHFFLPKSPLRDGHSLREYGYERYKRLLWRDS